MKISAPSKREMLAEIAHEFDQERAVGYEAILDWQPLHLIGFPTQSSDLKNV
jgi:hypothetical protein